MTAFLGAVEPRRPQAPQSRKDVSRLGWRSTCRPGHNLLLSRATDEAGASNSGLVTMQTIDAHCYLGKGVHVRQELPDLLRELDLLAVDRAVICPVDQYVTVYSFPFSGGRSVEQAVLQIGELALPEDAKDAILGGTFRRLVRL